MGKRFGNYKINWHINDVWDKTLTFWQNHRGKIRDQFISSNTLYRELRLDEIIRALNAFDVNLLIYLYLFHFTFRSLRP